MRRDAEAATRAGCDERAPIPRPRENEAREERIDAEHSGQRLSVGVQRAVPDPVAEGEDEGRERARDHIGAGLGTDQDDGAGGERGDEGHQRVEPPRDRIHGERVRPQPAGEHVDRKARRVRDAEHIGHRLRFGFVADPDAGRKHAEIHAENDDGHERARERDRAAVSRCDHARAAIR